MSFIDCQKNINKIVEKDGFITEDCIFDVCNKAQLSVVEIDQIWEYIYLNNIIIKKNASDDYQEERLVVNNGDSYQIIETFCSIQRKKDLLRFALVRFGDYQRYDIRVWYDNASKPGKGMSLSEGELRLLKNGLDKMDFNSRSFLARAHYSNGKVNATIYDQICLLGTYSVKGIKWNKEVAVVDFGYGKKVDLRKWADDYSVCGKGVSITFSEAKELFETMCSLINSGKML